MDTNKEYDNHLMHLREHEIMVKQFEQEKKYKLLQAESKLHNATNFNEIAELVTDFISVDRLIDLYEEFKEVNVYYNSPLAQAMREE